MEGRKELSWAGLEQRGGSSESLSLRPLTSRGRLKAHRKPSRASHTPVLGDPALDPKNPLKSMKEMPLPSNSRDVLGSLAGFMFYLSGCDLRVIDKDNQLKVTRLLFLELPG